MKVDYVIKNGIVVTPQNTIIAGSQSRGLRSLRLGADAFFRRPSGPSIAKGGATLFRSSRHPLPFSAQEGLRKESRSDFMTETPERSERSHDHLFMLCTRTPTSVCEEGDEMGGR